MTDTILKYFNDLTENQISQYTELGKLYPEWNDKINVISRKDIENLYVNHILHSLSIAKFTNFKDGSTILDVGTGGGFPGIPLAIKFPNVSFHLVDRTGKKILVAKSIAETIGLKNVTFHHGDVAEVKDKYDFVVSRAVMELDGLIKLIKKNVKKECINGLPNGLICLKGGELEKETSKTTYPKMIESISTYFDEDFFETKKIVYVQL